MVCPTEPSATPPPVTLLSLPPEIISKIAAHLTVTDICRLAQVNRQLNFMADSTVVWKPLYRSVFNYDEPLMNPKPRSYTFVTPDERRPDNPWKLSYSQLHHAIHVRPQYEKRTCRGNATYFHSVQTAIVYAKHLHFLQQQKYLKAAYREYCSNLELSNTNGTIVNPLNRRRLTNNRVPLIIVHAGSYWETPITIEWDLAVIGAASGGSGNIARQVKIYTNLKSVMSFKTGAENAYVGHLSLVMHPRRITDSRRPFARRCVRVSQNCSPTIEHCLMNSNSAIGMVVEVSGVGANPWIRHCAMSSPGGIGLAVSRRASGVYEANAVMSIQVRNAKPMMRQLDVDKAGLWLNLRNSVVCVTNNGLCTLLTRSVGNIF